MQDILGVFTDSGNTTMTLILLIIACLRVYLEVVGFNFEKLPLTCSLNNRMGNDYGKKLHRYGLFFSIGYIILFAPTFLLS